MGSGLLIYSILTGMVDPTQPPDYFDASFNQVVSSTQRLQGVFIKETGRFAVVDNIIVKQNDMLPDGATVIAIEQHSVTLHKPNVQDEILQLPSSVRRDGN